MGRFIGKTVRVWWDIPVKPTFTLRVIAWGANLHKRTSPAGDALDGKVARQVERSFSPKNCFEESPTSIELEREAPIVLSLHPVPP
jgi:hypothetical protein